MVTDPMGTLRWHLWHPTAVDLLRIALRVSAYELSRPLVAVPMLMTIGGSVAAGLLSGRHWYHIAAVAFLVVIVGVVCRNTVHSVAPEVRAGTRMRIALGNAELVSEADGASVVVPYSAISVFRRFWGLLLIRAPGLAPGLLVPATVFEAAELERVISAVPFTRNT